MTLALVTRSSVNYLGHTLPVMAGLDPAIPTLWSAALFLIGITETSPVMTSEGEAEGRGSSGVAHHPLAPPLLPSWPGLTRPSRCGEAQRSSDRDHPHEAGDDGECVIR
ncbi:hypothetical protein KHP60_07340 [Microvirga sp. 3-52]|uniref:hypothetical protein n=1 Tax=Microvirga sp. 3-52 TaxID=2792425 RepID=UPI001BCBDE55|nr:hypothetical protein [Microvirga sp. 3-52]MBS7452162.1 hypothetical protein [Microvirga sp. 3-52]